jgi:hypothetical protein
MCLCHVFLFSLVIFSFLVYFLPQLRFSSNGWNTVALKMDVNVRVWLIFYCGFEIIQRKRRKFALTFISDFYKLSILWSFLWSWLTSYYLFSPCELSWTNTTVPMIISSTCVNVTHKINGLVLWENAKLRRLHFTSKLGESVRPIRKQ